MSPPKTPATVKSATALLERHADLEGRVAAFEANRVEEIASTNAAVDRLVAPLLKQLSEIKTALEPWWRTNAAELTGGKRKSAELGGCMVGTQLARASLAHPFDSDDQALVSLKDERWAKPYLRVKVSIDRTATLKGLDGLHGKRLGELGFFRKPGADEFFVQRVEQAGVVGT